MSRRSRCEPCQKRFARRPDNAIERVNRLSLEQLLTITMRESERLAALASYDMLDTPRERDFDEIADLAARICGTPIAVVNLIAEGRQFFKAEVGLGVRETPLDSSFCAKAILEEDFLLVPDATRDHRFDCNPLVTGEPGLRFYAGALLKTEQGHAIGRCVCSITSPTTSPTCSRIHSGCWPAR